jgi:hypothetical protein
MPSVRVLVSPGLKSLGRLMGIVGVIHLLGWLFYT